MAKDDIVQYNLRLNLNNPYDLKLHQAIMNANLKIYKSKNNYLRKAMYRGIFGETEENDTKNDIIDFRQFVSKKELLQVETRVKETVIEEVVKLLFSTVANKTVVPAVQQSETSKEEDIDSAVTDIALGYF